MKSIFKHIYIIAIGVVIFSSLMLTSNASELNVETKDIELYKEEIEEINCFGNINIIKKENGYFYTYNNVQCELEYAITKAVDDTNNIYMLGKKDEIYYLLNLNKDTKKINKLILEIDEANDLVVYCDNLIVGGSKNNNVYIAVCDKKLEIIRIIHLDGDKTQKCTHLLVKNNLLYICGIKSAHSKNENFLNIGSRGEIKSFIFSYDKDYVNIDKCYFNDDYEEEKIIETGFLNDNLLICMKANENYIIELSDDLNAYNKYLIPYSNYQLINTPKKSSSSIILVVIKDNYFNIMSMSNNNYKNIISIDGNFLNYQIVEGELYIYYTYNGYTYKKIIDEYHIDYLNPLKCNYFTNDETSQNHFLVESYFEDLSFLIDSITPYYEKNIPGNYTITYLCKRQNMKEIRIKTSLIVSNYVNIKDKRIYPKGTRLFFFGKAILNGEEIPNGTILQKEGENILKIINQNRDEAIYKFTVVSNYYKNVETINISADYVTYCNDIMYFKIDNRIKNIYFDQYGLGKIQILNNDKYLEIKASNKAGITNYKINKIELEDGRINECAISFLIKTLKAEPQYQIYEYIENDMLNLDIDVRDETASIDDVYLECYQDANLVLKKSTYINNTNGEIANLTKNKKFFLNINVINEEDNIDTLFTYEGVFNKEGTLKYSIDFKIENNKIIKIMIKLNLKNKFLKHHKILLANQDGNDLIKKYTINNNYILLYISIGCSVILMCILIILIIKRRKRRINN